MFDFMMVSTRSKKRGSIEIYPKFIVKSKCQDLMIRGGDFYAIWVEELGLWSKDEGDAIKLIDRELDRYYEENKARFEGEAVRVLHLWDSEAGMIDAWHKYCQKQMRDSFHTLDEQLNFANSTTAREHYCSRRLPYSLEDGDISAYDKLVSTLYSAEERHKLEWAMGAVVSGDSKKIQKFLVLYGAAGTGKSTMLNIMQQLFEGYYSVFDAKALGSSNNAFALESFKNNPLVAIQHDGDLSRIEDNTRLNSLVSHEVMEVNAKYERMYSSRFNAFLFMGTNKPVKITDAKSGLMRRLIDVTPSGNKLSSREYKQTVKQVGFELGAIAKHCLGVYLEDPGYYDDYVPINMLGASNDFYNYILDSYHVFKKEDGTTLQAAWEMYKQYCDEAKVGYPYSKRLFKEELKNYFYSFSDRFETNDGLRVRSYYSGFRTDKLEDVNDLSKPADTKLGWLIMDAEESVFDKNYSDCFAQYAIGEDDRPEKPWGKVTTKLSDIDTKKVHYVKPPETMVVIDLDLKDESGNKSFEKNLEEANKWPPTYGELSKGGAGIHLHYLYTGDVSKLAGQISKDVELKKFLGGSALRRRLSKCNTMEITTLSSGLPLKEDKVINAEAVKSEQGLRRLIKRNLAKEIHPGTKPSVEFIKKILDDAYENGLKYDVSDMRGAIGSFAANSHHWSAMCMKMVSEMKFSSDDPSEPTRNDEACIVFYDVEVFPNLFVVCWKKAGEEYPVMTMINPSSTDIEALTHFRLIGFNCRKYDNHIMYGRINGYDNEQLYNLSQKIISHSDRDCFFREAYNMSYTDILDFSSKKQSLKKFEIELGIHHQELGLPWDQPVPEELWQKVAEYCKNDVIATEAVFFSKDRQADWTARQILAELADMTVNDTTNTLTTKIIFGNNKNPQNEFMYRNLAEPVTEVSDEMMQYLKDYNLPTHFTAWDGTESILPCFPGYEFKRGRSFYRDIEFGEGGFVSAKPGIWADVSDEDVSGQHPSTIRINCFFGPRYTRRYNDIVDARVAIKHGDFETAKTMLDGKLAKYLDDPSQAKVLGGALKIAVNSVYGLTFASFKNAFRDSRNVDNLVAKMGELFMIDLMNEVEKRGFTVAHIKTDSIKVPHATDDMVNFIWEFGKKYGFNFEHEAHFERMCLVNKAAFIAKFSDNRDINGDDVGKWYPKATQFQVPYVFKTLFSHEPIGHMDFCETKSVNEGSIYIDMCEDLPDVTEYEQQLSKAEKKHADGSMADTDFETLKTHLEEKIAQGHNYVFVGRVGLFTPIKPGCGGGFLYRFKDGKRYAINGTKDYMWLESEVVDALDKWNCVNEEYYTKQVNAVIEDISKFGDFDKFVSEEPYEAMPAFMNVPVTDNEEVPFI